MKRVAAPSVGAYIAAQPRATQAVLKRVRAAIRGALPAAEEAISYGVPVYELHGTYVVYFAAFKQHWSLYPAGDRLVAAVRGAAAHRVSRGTLRFALSEPVPEALVARVARFLAKEARERAQARRARAKPAKTKRRG